jgi:hypothetical protein
MTHHSLIVQYRVSGWGSPTDLEKRHRLSDLLDDCLEEAENGCCDGGDIGSGSINIFLEEVIDPQRACDTIVAALQESGDLEGAVIALNLDPDGTNEEGPYHSILWPQDYHGDFSIL